ncbi:hypothetical protein MPTK1_4g12340 [Marchantia polymorpha subsp. ruderalis]|uniref:Uncharacterized protein n=2 Tax=Marchantia polymorpha TaxID=3197 RepID=A0AAF6B949_MARPO|nr:hypothetical protein MARPO_0011s0216 [Marchantia polymorpha]BBN08533.1 hypothetical protein Mp_4g12340 [Marchantia polymorpha subsp. ruderalis]|eukprot:PTQ46567.1 hypothetical protein MARPO_0011s0216 [Marchantia polymorpha]
MEIYWLHHANPSRPARSHKTVRYISLYLSYPFQMTIICLICFQTITFLNSLDHNLITNFVLTKFFPTSIYISSSRYIFYAAS